MRSQEFKLRRQSAKRREYPEMRLQRAVVQFLAIAMPQDSFWFSVPNGAWLADEREGAKLKWLGLKPGVPDLCIVYRGMAFGIELKAGKNKATDDQLRVHQELARAGGHVCVCYTLDEVRLALIDWHIPLRIVGKWVPHRITDMVAA